MEEWKEEALMWTITLALILGTFVIIFFVLANSTHVELLDSIYIPDKHYKINAYYFDAGATGGGVSLEKEYKNGKKNTIYISDGFFNDVKELELIDNNRLKVILGFKIKPNKFAQYDTIFIDLNLLETEERKAIQQRIIKFLVPGIFMLIGIIIIIFRKGFKYKIQGKKRSEYMIRCGIILIIISLYLFVFLSRMLR